MIVRALTWLNQFKTWPLLALPFFLAFALVQLNQPWIPLVIHSGKTLDPVVTGETMETRWDITWNEDCPTTVEVYFVSLSNTDKSVHTVILRRGPVQAAFSGGGRHEWIRRVVIPSELPDGDYMYRVRFTVSCKRGNYSATAPDIPFSIRRK